MMTANDTLIPKTLPYLSHKSSGGAKHGLVLIKVWQGNLGCYTSKHCLDQSFAMIRSILFAYHYQRSVLWEESHVVSYYILKALIIPTSLEQLHFFRCGFDISQNMRYLQYIAIFFGIIFCDTFKNMRYIRYAIYHGCCCSTLIPTVG